MNFPDATGLRWGASVLAIGWATIIGISAEPLPGTPSPWRSASVSIDTALTHIEKTLGVKVDRNRQTNANEAKSSKDTLWAAVDDLLEPAGFTLLPTGAPNQLKLIKKPSTDSRYANSTGPFRVVLKRMTSRADVETGEATTEAVLALHWEPRLAVYRVHGLNFKTPTAAQAESPKANVVGAVHPLTAKFKTPSSKTIEITGSLTVTAAEKLLRVRFDKLTGEKAEQTVDTVTVKLVRFEKIDDVIEAEVAYEYPPGMPQFESFEEECWLRDNVGRVISPDRTKSHESTDFQTRVTPRGAVIVFRFPWNAAKGLTPGPGWMLEVVTPTPLKEMTVPFSLTGLPRP